MKLTNRSSRPVFAAVGVVTAVICLALAAAAEPGYDVKPKQAPALPDKGWLNTPGNKPLKLDELRGKVVLVEFWTFACFNCRNTLPYVKAWHEKYAKQGLVVIGVHSPEFDFERKPENVQNSLRELGGHLPDRVGQRLHYLEPIPEPLLAHVLPDRCGRADRLHRCGRG